MLSVRQKDEICKAFQSSYENEGTVDTFMKHTSLSALLALAEVNRFQFSYYERGNPPELMALEEYMTAQRVVIKL